MSSGKPRGNATYHLGARSSLLKCCETLADATTSERCWRAYGERQSKRCEGGMREVPILLGDFPFNAPAIPVCLSQHEGASMITRSNFDYARLRAASLFLHYLHV